MLEQSPQAHHSSVVLNMGQVNTDAQVAIMRKQIPESTIITCLHVLPSLNLEPPRVSAMSYSALYPH